MLSSEQDDEARPAERRPDGNATPSSACGSSGQAQPKMIVVTPTRP